MKIHASQRLTVANADEAAARQFIKSVAGIEVGKLEHSTPDTIRFTVNDKADFDRAFATLTKHFGQPDTSKRVGWSQAGSWKVDAEKSIYLGDQRFGGGHQPNPYHISLFDQAHRETTQQYLKRIMGPTRAINR